MKKLSAYDIRKMWLEFWQSKGHDIIESAPLVPINDPTLLWINSGVASLKRFFDGSEIPKNKKMANAQKSIRTNDIENVGKTARHHTFFEMLGNFSIGDYFRDEALEYAIEILTSPKWYGFDLNKLYFTVYPDDQESIDKWVLLGVPRSHIFKLEGNFWEIGEGPCGPNTEVFYDRGPKYDPDNLGTRLISEDISNDRYIEIWNIVFSQFSAKANQKRSEYKELPYKNIDTGMGLERMACIIQETETNYETDLFMPIIKECEKITGIKYTGQMAFKVISDHIRSVSFALSDGASFANEGRGYVLRRLLRRAVSFAKTLGMKEAFLYRLVSVVNSIMKGFYPNLISQEALITKQIKLEEEKFLLTLISGEKRLLDYMAEVKTKQINKETAFLLYDTFGFPFDLTKELAAENGFDVDEAGFISLLEEQKQRARSARLNMESMSFQNEDMIKFKKASKFIGYDNLESKSKVIAIFKEGKLVKVASGDVLVVFDKTPFYAEAGGQVGDIGKLYFNNKSYDVVNTIRLPNAQHALYINLRNDELKLDDEVSLAVDADLRASTARNHSATHLLNEALREVVGAHVSQQGSYVGPNRFRFDFNNFNLLSNDEILKVEALVNEEINLAKDINIKETSLEEAKSSGAQALFGEKYDDIVRVVELGFSKELCGGTHVSNTGEIGKMAILSIETKGSGIYRIEGTTKPHIIDELNISLENILSDIAYLETKINELLIKAKALNVKLIQGYRPISSLEESYISVINKRKEVEELRSYARSLEKEIERKELEKASLQIKDYLHEVKEKAGEKHLVFNLNNVNIEIAKELVDALSSHLVNSLIFVSIVLDDRVIFISKNKIARLNAGKLVKEASLIVGGNGGGRQDFAQAGGKDISKVELALDAVRKLVEV